jgi:hypothetical protein
VTAKRHTLAVAVAVASFLVVQPAGATHVRGQHLFPDLVTRKPTGLAIRFPQSGGRVLRLGNEIVNAHTGPLELLPSAEDCDRNGDPTDDRTAYQRIYLDRNRDGYFTRRVDTRFWTKSAGCMRFHASHEHWHVDAFARYDLRAYAPGGAVGAVVRTSGKVSYCVGDHRYRLRGLPGSPRRGYYGPRRTGCGQDDVMGLSAGWGDVYGARTPGQFIDVTGLRSGAYCLVSRADPTNRIAERNERNNGRRMRIRLTHTSVIWRPYRRC